MQIAQFEIYMIVVKSHCVLLHYKSDNMANFETLRPPSKCVIEIFVCCDGVFCQVI